MTGICDWTLEITISISGCWNGTMVVGIPITETIWIPITGTEVPITGTRNGTGVPTTGNRIPITGTRNETGIPKTRFSNNSTMVVGIVGGRFLT